MALRIPDGVRLGEWEQQPWIRFGQGESLLFLPGLTDGFGSPHVQVRQLYAQLKDLSEVFEVTVLGRRRPCSDSLNQMAEDALGYLKEAGPAHVAGISMGGMILQYMLQKGSGNMKSATLIATGSSQTEKGRDNLRKMQDEARSENWQELQNRALKMIYGEASGGLRPAARPPESIKDFISSAEACIRHQFSGLSSLPQIPVQLIGGRKDPLYPPEKIEELARRLGITRPVFVEEGGHGLLGPLRETVHSCLKEILCVQ